MTAYTTTRKPAATVGRADVVASRLLEKAASTHRDPLVRSLAPLAVPFIAAQFSSVLGPGTFLGSLAQTAVKGFQEHLESQQQALEAQARAEDEAKRRATFGTMADPFQFVNCKPMPDPHANTGNMAGGRGRRRVKPLNQKGKPKQDFSSDYIDVQAEVVA